MTHAPRQLAQGLHFLRDFIARRDLTHAQECRDHCFEIYGGLSEEEAFTFKHELYELDAQVDALNAA